MLMFFTTSDVQITDAGAREYMCLPREQELAKLRRRLDEEAILAKARRKAVEGASTRGGGGCKATKRDRAASRSLPWNQRR